MEDHFCKTCEIKLVKLTKTMTLKTPDMYIYRDGLRTLDS